MKFLLDTHLLLWIAGAPEKLPAQALSLTKQADNRLLFSPVSLLEVAIKHSLGREDFRVDPRVLRRGLMDNEYEELAVTGLHAVGVGDLPPIHKDPFDRLLVAQALSEGVTLVTVDEVVARYPGPILRV